MRDHEDAFREAGVSLAAIGLGGRRYAAEFRQESEIGFPLLVDAHRKAYRAVGLKSASLLGLLQPATLKARNRAKAAGHSQHRLGKDPLQLGGSFVFAPGNEDLYVHVSQSFGDNAPVDELAAAADVPV